MNLNYYHLMGKFIKSNCKSFLIFSLLLNLFLPKPTISAEGSVDFVGNPGWRLFLDVEKKPQFKVYANANEFINVGSSHLGFSPIPSQNLGGSIKVWRPDGTLHIEFKATSTTSTEAIINNNGQELNGPTGGGTTNGLGYVPGVVKVDPGQEGIWTVTFEYPSYTAGNFNTFNVLNSAPWTRAVNQPTNKRVVLAWDITVTKFQAGNRDGVPVKGRVFTNEFLSIVSESDSATTKSTSPKYYVLSKDGIQYKIDFLDTKPWGFPVSSNNLGLLNDKQEPCYCAEFDANYIKSATPLTWTPGNLYYYEPQAKDIGNIINNKIFINIPDGNMPTAALVTDIYRSDTYQTWLYNIPVSGTPKFDLESFKFTSGNPAYICNKDTTVVGLGGYLKFKSDAGGAVTLKIDINRDGDYDDPVDRVIFDVISVGTDSIRWDGKDGLGMNVPASNAFDFKFSIDLKYGEIHMLLYDIENNPGQVQFTRLNGANAPDNSVYYDFSRVAGPVSGGGTPGNPLPSTTTYTYNDIWGNRKMQDYFTYLDFKNVASGTIKITIVDTCVKACPVTLVKPSISGPSPVCSTDSIRLTVGSPYPGLVDTLSGVQYQWYNGNNQLITTTQNKLSLATNSPLAISPYKVQVFLSPECISPLSDELFITVNQAPVADANYSGPFCVGTSVDLIATNVSGATYEWRLLSGGPVLSTDRIYMLNNLTTSSAYQLKVSVAGCALASFDTLNVEVIPNAKATVVLQGGVGKFCGPGTVTLSAVLQTNATYEWRVLGKPTILSTSSTFITTVDTTTLFELTVKNATCPNAATDTVLVEVLEVPTAVAGNDVDGKLCAAGPVQLFANFVDNATYEWRIQGSPIVISTQQNPVVNVTATTVYELVIKVGICTSNVATTRIDLFTKPIISSVVGNFNVCEGDSFNVMINFLTDVNGTYVLTGPTVSTGSVNINGKTITLIIAKTKLSDSGKYKLQLTTSQGCAYDYDSIFTLVVNPIPIAVASNGGRVCKGNMAQLFANTVANANYEWRIKGNSTLYSVDQNPKVPNADTTTTYELIVVANGCASEPAYTTIDVLELPVITIEQDSIKVCEGDDIVLSAKVTTANYNGVIKYNWRGPNNFNFNGTTTSGVTFTVKIPSASVIHTGTYTLNTELEEVPNCMASAKSIYVDVIPKIKLFIDGNSPVCFGDTFKLNVKPDLLQNYVWKNANGVVLASGVTILNLPSVSPLAVSPISVTATYLGCTCFGDYILETYKLPTISATNDGPICENDTVTLTADLVANATYEWRVQGNSTIISTARTFKVVGLTTTTTYEVTVRLPNCNQSTKATTTVIVNKGPLVGALTGAGDYCIGSKVTLNATGGAGVGNVTYIWIYVPTQTPVFVGVAPKSGPFPFEINNVQVVNGGNYLLVLQDLTTGCTTLAGTVAINVKPNPIKPIITAVDDTICVGQSLILNCNSYTGNVTYTWYRNDTIIGTTTVNSFTIPNMTVAQRGQYKVKVNVNGCDSEISEPIFIEVFGQGMPFTITNPTSADKPACKGNALKIDAMVMNGASYMWFGPNGMIPNATGPSLLFSAVTTADAGLYYVKITKNECSTVYSDTIFLHVGDTPIANADNYTVEYNTTHTGKVLENDLLGNNKAVSIKILVAPKFGTAVVNNPNILYTPKINYIGSDNLVYEICSNLCPNECDTAVVTYFINGPEDCDPIPNVITPNNDEFNDNWEIPCLINYPDNQITIYNRWGDKVFEADKYKGTWNGTYNDSPLPAGTYFYILKLRPTDTNVKSGYVTIVR